MVFPDDFELPAWWPQWAAPSPLPSQEKGDNPGWVWSGEGSLTANNFILALWFGLAECAGRPRKYDIDSWPLFPNTKCRLSVCRGPTLYSWRRGIPATTLSVSITAKDLSLSVCFWNCSAWHNGTCQSWKCLLGASRNFYHPLPSVPRLLGWIFQ